MSALEVLQQMVAWARMLVLLGGLVVCVPHLRRSRWVAVLLTAFVVELAIGVFYRLAGLILGQRWIVMDGLRWAYLMASLLTLAGQALLVVGLAGLLADLRSGSQRAGRPRATP